MIETRETAQESGNKSNWNDGMKRNRVDWSKHWRSDEENFGVFEVYVHERAVK